jgi:branched-chain amino acid transport system substrate-binding protein
MIHNLSRKKRRALIAVPAVFAAFALSACSAPGGSSGDSGSDDGPYQVVVISGQTGALQANSEAMRAGLQAAVDTVNEADGINGHDVEVTYLDDKSDPTVGVTVLQQYLSENDNPDLVIAGQTSNEALALAPITTREKIVTFAAVQNPTLDDPETYPYFFSNAVKATTVTDAVASFLEDKGAKSVALVAANDALLQSVEPALGGSLEKVGIELSVHPFDPEAIDVSPAFAEAMDSGADWLYADAVGAAVPRLLEGRLKAGAEKMPTVGGSSVSSGQFLAVTTEEQRENLYPVLYPLTYYIAPEDRNDPLNSLIEKLGDPNELELPLNNDAYGWDYLAIWGAGVEQAGSAEPDAVKEALENLEASGKDASEQPWIMWRTLWSADTHYVQASPEEFMVAEVEPEPKDGMIVAK